jgi:hypothetical protein
MINIILDLMKENQQFKNMLIEQHNHILKITEKPTITNCNNNNNTSLGNTCPGGVEKNNERILKNILKGVYVHKNTIM